MYGNPNITIRWDTIQIIFAAIFAFVFLFAVLLLLVNRYAVKQLTKMNYKNVLKCKRILLAFNFNPKTVWMVHLILAVASYETGNEADFIKYINLMKERKAQPAALYWKAIYMFFKGQEDTFERYFEELKRVVQQEYNEINIKYVRTLEILVKKRNGEYLTEEDMQQIEKSVSKTIKEYIAG
ncbi:MAG: hypothetical protein IKB54_06460 [Clostridia bacterium]|nr:hypothetical protein [Clostridia bacterium]